MNDLACYWWEGYSLDHDRNEARAHFIRKHGYAPERIEVDAILFVGPIRGSDENERANVVERIGDFGGDSPAAGDGETGGRANADTDT